MLYSKEKAAVRYVLTLAPASLSKSYRTCEHSLNPDRQLDSAFSTPEITAISAKHVLEGTSFPHLNQSITHGYAESLIELFSGSGKKRLHVLNIMILGIVIDVQMDLTFESP
jgi:hypothetical protein